MPDTHKQSNPYHRPVDDRGKIIATREAYAKEIRVILEANCSYNLLNVEHDHKQDDCLIDTGGHVLKALAQYVAVEAYAEYASSVKLGVSLGRKDVLKMLEALAGQAKELGHGEFCIHCGGAFKVKAVPLSELQAVIKAVKEGQV